MGMDRIERTVRFQRFDFPALFFKFNKQGSFIYFLVEPRLQTIQDRHCGAK